VASHPGLRVHPRSHGVSCRLRPPWAGSVAVEEEASRDPRGIIGITSRPDPGQVLFMEALENYPELDAAIIAEVADRHKADRLAHLCAERQRRRSALAAAAAVAVTTRRSGDGSSRGSHGAT